MKVFIGSPFLPDIAYRLPAPLVALAERFRQWWSRPRVLVDEHDVTEVPLTIAAIAAPLLRRLAEEALSYPTTLDPADCLPELDEMENWRHLIAKMARAFELVLADQPIYTEEEEQDIAAGLRLFAKYYRALWN